VKLSDGFGQLPTDGTATGVYGEPYQTADGATVIPVAKPTGIFVIHGGESSWVPAFDANRAAQLGLITGLLAAVIGSLAVLIGSLAVLRQPPWPRITITDYR
jgi:hypothetical protein